MRGRFEDEWPALEARLARRLADRLPDPAVREEVLEEISLRLVVVWDELDPARPVWPLVLSIALQVQHDVFPASFQAEERSGEVKLPASLDGVLDAEVVQRAVGRLDPTQRSAFLAELERVTRRRGR